jgi:hypothetical protein
MAQIPLRGQTIAVIWSFDRTLSSNSLQPLFSRFGVDEGGFWSSIGRSLGSATRKEAQGASPDVGYLERILAYTRTGTLDGLNNSMLYELGSEISLYDGLPEFFERLAYITEKAAPGVKVDHYIISTRLSKMIEGSRVGPYVRRVWACEFDVSLQPDGGRDGAGPLFEASTDPILSSVSRSIDSSTKVSVLCEINRKIGARADGTNGDTRKRFRNMIHVGGVLSNGPAFNAVSQCGGRAIAVYDPRYAADFRLAERLRTQNLVQDIGEANYLDGSVTSSWITNSILDLALLNIEESSTNASGEGCMQNGVFGVGTASAMYPMRSTGIRNALSARPTTPVESASWPNFSAACRKFLGRQQYVKRECRLRELHDNYVASFCDHELSGFMAEFTKSVAGTPQGLQRRASASENSGFDKLVLFLEKLRRKHKIA